MQHLQKIFLMTGLLMTGLVMTACPEDVPPSNDGGVPDPDQCRNNRECAAGSICDKDPADEFGTCLKILCLGDADCSETEFCDLRRGLCLPDNLCDPANPGAVCEAGQFCVYTDGVPQCLDEGELPPAADCDIEPALVIAKDGEAITLAAQGLNSDGKLVPNASFTFTADTGTFADAAFTGECAAGVCDATITATSGAATCTAAAKVYAAVPAADTRIVVIDQRTGAPLAGAPVALKAGANLLEGTTDADGAFVFAGQAAADAVSAFPSSHQWQTIVSPGSNDIVVYTVPVPNAAVAAGVKGEFNFDNVSTQGDIRLGLAGLSISSAITDLDFNLLIGELANYNIVLDGVTDPGGQAVPLPSGLVMELGTETIKENFVTLSEPGKRTLWALGGKVRISQIGDVISGVVADTENINVGSLLTAILPFFAKFDHSIVSGLDVSEITRPTAPGEDEPIPFGDWDLESLEGANAVDLNTLLSQSVTYDLPRLPCAAGAATGADCSAYATGAVMLSGVVVPGQGLVPLGLTAGLDDPDSEDGVDEVDGQVDYATEAPAKGQAIIDYAPPHDGMEGNDYLTLAIAVDIDALVAAQLSASILVHASEGFGANNTFPAQSFLELQGGTFSRGTKSFAISAVGDADFYRLNLNGDEEAGTDNQEWNIWFGDAADASGLNIDDLRPAGITGRDTGVDVQAFRLGTGGIRPEPASYGALVGFNGTNFGDLLYYMGAWSSTTCADAGEDGEVPHCAFQ